MSYQQLTPLPGVCKVDSAYANSIKASYTSNGVAVGRYTDMLAARFIAGRPEKKGGFALNTTSKLNGICRGIKDFRDFSQNLYCAFGTNTKLYILNVTTLVDVTPFRIITTGTISNALTTNGTTTVKITQTAHGQLTGDYVELSNSAAIDGVILGNTYFITVVDANNYTVTVPTAATGSTSGAGGVLTFSYFRVVLTNPFATTNGSNNIVVMHTAHGANVGDSVVITGGSAVAGLTITGEFVIQSTTVNTYVIVTAAKANATTTGGGTPSFQYEINIGLIDAGNLQGYGTGGYGQDPGTGYGTSNPSTALVEPRVWFLDNYGQQLLACPYGGTIYVWDPTVQSINTRAYPLYGAPTNNLGMFVTPERFVFSIGNTSNYLEVQWPDQNNYNDWVPLPTNTANARTLQIGSVNIGGIAVRDGTSLIITNSCAYAFTYSGDQFVYDSTAAGRNSGLIGPLAICAYGGNAYWMGIDEFWTWNGSVQPLPSDDIRDFVFKNINAGQAWKCFAVTNTAKKEVTFYYPVNGAGNEITASVTYHVDQGIWSNDTKSRTSQIDALLFEFPISTDTSGNIWNEEFGTDANGSALHSYVTFSPMAVSKGDKRCDVMGFLPDFERQSGNLTCNVLTQTYPDDPQTIVGPFTLLPNDQAPLIDMRIGATFVGYNIDSNVVGGDYRVGLCQVDVDVAGARR